MATPDASIYSSLLAQPKSSEEYSREANETQASALRNLLARSTYDQQQQAIQRKQEVRTMLASPGFDLSAPQSRQQLIATDPDSGFGYIKDYNEGLRSEAQIRQANAASQSSLLEAAGKKLTQHLQLAGQIRTPQEMVQWISAGVQGQVPGMTPDRAQMILQEVQSDPRALPQLLKKIQMGGLELIKQIELQTPKYERQDTGSSIQMVQMNPHAGPVGLAPGVAPIQKTATPGELLSAQTSSDNNIRSNARMSAYGGTGPAKPMPAAALKMQQEALDGIGIAGGINADLGALIEQMDTGKLKLGPLSNLVNSGRNYSGYSNEESRNLASFKATLEKLRNDSLRLNKGVQTDGDAQRAWNELLTNINDPRLVKQRLGEIQSLNERAADLHEMNLDAIRQNYGAPTMDTSTRRRPGTALNHGASGSWDAPDDQKTRPAAKTNSGATVSNW